MSTVIDAICFDPRPFTREQEERLRQIIRKELDADRERHSGLTGDAAENYEAALKSDRAASSAGPDLLRMRAEAGRFVQIGGQDAPPHD